MKNLVALLPLALALVSSAALANPAIVTGPLGDQQVVRGKKAGFSASPGNGSGYFGAASTLHYGFQGTAGNTATMIVTGYGNQVAFVDVPADAASLVYTITDADGTVRSNDGQPYAVAVRDRAVSITKPSPGASTLQVRYAGPVSTTYDTYLHLGWNNWNQIGDVFMTRTQFSYTKAGVSYDYNSVDVTPPWWANYLDFVVKDARNGGTWDNNGGQNWHQGLHPFVSTGVYAGTPGTTYVTVTYADGSLNPPILHYGTDGWQNVADLAMSSVYGGYQAQVPVSATATTMEFAFRDGNGNWENNFGMNWSVALH